MSLNSPAQTHSPRPSMGAVPGDGTNTTCHGFTGGVQPNNKRVIDAPQVTLRGERVMFLGRMQLA